VREFSIGHLPGNSQSLAELFEVVSHMTGLDLRGDSLDALALKIDGSQKVGLANCAGWLTSKPFLVAGIQLHGDPAGSPQQTFTVGEFHLVPPFRDCVPRRGVRAGSNGKARTCSLALS